MDPAAVLVFIGSGISKIAPGGAMVSQLELLKDNNSLELLDDLNVEVSVLFGLDNNHLILNDNFLTLQENTTVLNADENRYIITNGPGKLKKEISGNGSSYLPIGTSNGFSPITLSYEGANYANAFIAAGVKSETHPNSQHNVVDYIEKYWEIDSQGIDDPVISWMGVIEADDIVGNVNEIVRTIYAEGDWTYDDQAIDINNFSGATSYSTFAITGSNYYTRIKVKAFLQAAYNPSTGLMSTSLNQAGLIPLSSPYPDAPATVNTIPEDVTDWVKLEFRDPLDPELVLAKAPAFLRSDGTITGLNGIYSVGVFEGNEEYVVSIHHRNHLPVRTATGLDALFPIQYDISQGQNQAFQNPNILTNDAMKHDSGINEAYVLWGGNPIGNNAIRATGLPFINDVTNIIATLGNFTDVITNTYSNADTNMDGTVRATGLPFLNDVTFIISNLGNFTHILNAHN